MFNDFNVELVTTCFARCSGDGKRFRLLQINTSEILLLKAKSLGLDSSDDLTENYYGALVSMAMDVSTQTNAELLFGGGGQFIYFTFRNNRTLKKLHDFCVERLTYYLDEFEIPA